MKTIDITNKNQIIPIWKPVGLSTHTISKGISVVLGVPVAHTGTLDPMAEGVIVLLAGEKRYNKIEFAGWKKEYEFEILFGLSTDTYDPMGFLTSEDISFKFYRHEFEEVLKSFQPSYIQTYPPFSAKRVGGKPMHYYAQKGELEKIQAPTLEANIYEVAIDNIYQLTLNEFIKNTVKKISTVEGFFRQEPILESWNKFSESKDLSQRLTIVKLRVLVSRGVYVRALTVDIASKMGTCALTYSIVRTKNGIYNKESCFEIPKF